ncbi:hypothetical protein NE237_016573 [Protea cynaroides]|uniref:RNase H type-1 domain-containing protein n=1 Tax=Protea cynaroides TaxID=273540 RepID=A0A9Q0HF28_9MAGN|nr:hypothetical protein NE237_016573 [Protea cynaroides]
MAFMCWALWTTHNELYFGHLNLSSELVICRVEKGFREYHAATKPIPDVTPLVLRLGMISSHRWAPPPPGLVTMNIDAALGCKQCVGGIGVVIRNHEHANFKTSTIGKALAMRAGIAKTIELSFTALTVESDSMVVVNLVNGVSKDCNVYLAPLSVRL